MTGDLVKNLKRAGEQVLGAKGLTGNDHVRLSALLKVAALEVEALRVAEGAARDDAAELRAALEAVYQWLRSEFAEPDPTTGEAVEAAARDIWETVCAALAATEGSE